MKDEAEMKVMCCEDDNETNSKFLCNIKKMQIFVGIQ